MPGRDDEMNHPGRWRALRCSRSEADVRNTGANGDGPRTPAQLGQNDPEIAMPRRARSAALLDRQIRPSSKNRVKDDQRRS